MNFEECEAVDSYYVVCFDQNNTMLGFRKFGENTLRIENTSKILNLAFKFGANLNN